MKNLLIITALFGISCAVHAQQPTIDIWYGNEQYFGVPARAQNWINVLGNVSPANRIAQLSYQLNGGDQKMLTLGSDLHRLAREGDFNIELRWEDVNTHENLVSIHATTKNGQTARQDVKLIVEKGNEWPLPYVVDFSRVDQLQKVAQVVDGKWELTAEGVRTTEPYYDRVLTMGDSSWENYEVNLSLTIHHFTPPQPGPPTYDVSHFGVALRWRGHVPDGRQPNRRWYPLGAQGELLLRAEGDSSRWRVLRGGGEHWIAPPFSQYREIDLNRPLRIRAQVATLEDGQHVYRFKQWNEGEPEPLEWDVEALEERSRDFESGAFCIVPHNSDVTIHRVEAILLK